MDMFTVKKRQDVLSLLDETFHNKKIETETVDLLSSVGRIICEDLHSRENVPAFRRSTVDGYAVRSKDTVGCSDALPAFLNIAGETRMGEGTGLTLNSFEAIYVPTGGIVPSGADAVVMIEYTEKFDDDIAISRPVSQRENIVGIGDDVTENEAVISKHTQLKTQHVGALAALGISNVSVYKKPKVAILSTGDELVDVNSELSIGKIRDVNAYSLNSMLNVMGCEIIMQARIKDDFEKIKETLEKATSQCDIVLISGGSSVGNKDMTPEIINALGDPGVLVHGIAIKPGKPTIVAKVRDTAVFGLPGHPASCIISYKSVVEPFIKYTLLKSQEKERFIKAKSGFQMHVSSGRDVFYMVSLDDSGDEYVAHPVHGKSGMISLLSKSDGFIEIPMEKEGLQIGEEVRVQLFR